MAICHNFDEVAVRAAWGGQLGRDQRGTREATVWQGGLQLQWSVEGKKEIMAYVRKRKMGTMREKEMRRMNE